MKSEPLLSEIELKAKSLQQRLQRLTKENKTLQDSVFEYLKQLDENRKEILELKKKVANQQLAERIELDKKQLQKEIDRYVQLVDKCIATLKVNF